MRRVFTTEFEEKVKERKTDEALTKEEVVGFYENINKLKEEYEKLNKEGIENIILKSNKVLDEFFDFYHENYEDLSDYFKKTFPKEQAEHEWTVKDVEIWELERVDLTIYRQDGFNHIEKTLILPTEVFYNKDYYYTEKGKEELVRRQILGHRS